MKLFYVVGKEASKSLSPTIFNYWFKKYKISAKYDYLQLNDKNFEKKIEETIKNRNIYGLNITIPFKQKIIKHLDVLDVHAKKINAVNCVSLGKKNIGINTDWEGYYKTLPRMKNFKKKKIVMFGYGGAALAIHYVLINKGFRNIVIINRTKKKLNFLNNNKYTIKLDNTHKHLQSSDLIINTTPKNPINKKDISLIGKNVWLSDIVYKPKETAFLKRFPNNKKIYGISMLLQQAVPCFKLWFGFKPQIDDDLLKILERKIR